MKNKIISIIIACYNEEKNIASTIKRVHKVMPESEIVIVDDGSTDKTMEVVGYTLMKEKVKHSKIVKYMPNRGKGYAIKQGVLCASGDIQVQLDADCQFQPEETPKLIQPILDKKCDITFCTRFSKGGTFEKGSVTKMRRLANAVVSTLTSFLSGRYWFKNLLTDINAGFKAWTKKSILDIDFRCPHFGYEGEIAILAHKKGYKIIEVPINYKKRLEGNTNVKLWRDGVIIPLYFLKTKLFR